MICLAPLWGVTTNADDDEGGDANRRVDPSRPDVGPLAVAPEDWGLRHQENSDGVVGAPIPLMSLTKCEHWFHLECITRQAGHEPNNPRCPSCRTSILPRDLVDMGLGNLPAAQEAGSSASRAQVSPQTVEEAEIALDAARELAARLIIEAEEQRANEEERLRQEAIAESARGENARVLEQNQMHNVTNVQRLRMRIAKAAIRRKQTVITEMRKHGLRQSRERSSARQLRAAQDRVATLHGTMDEDALKKAWGEMAAANQENAAARSILSTHPLLEPSAREIASDLRGQIYREIHAMQNLLIDVYGLEMGPLLATPTVHNDQELRSTLHVRALRVRPLLVQLLNMFEPWPSDDEKHPLVLEMLEDEGVLMAESFFWRSLDGDDHESLYKRQRADLDKLSDFFIRLITTEEWTTGRYWYPHPSQDPLDPPTGAFKGRWALDPLLPLPWLEREPPALNWERNEHPEWPPTTIGGIARGELPAGVSTWQRDPNQWWKCVYPLDNDRDLAPIPASREMQVDVDAMDAALSAAWDDDEGRRPQREELPADYLDRVDWLDDYHRVPDGALGRFIPLMRTSQEKVLTNLRHYHHLLNMSRPADAPGTPTMEEDVRQIVEVITRIFNASINAGAGAEGGVPLPSNRMTYPDYKYWGEHLAQGKLHDDIFFRTTASRLVLTMEEVNENLGDWSFITDPRDWFSVKSMMALWYDANGGMFVENKYGDEEYNLALDEENRQLYLRVVMRAYEEHRAVRPNFDYFAHNRIPPDLEPPNMRCPA